MKSEKIGFSDFYTVSLYPIKISCDISLGGQNLFHIYSLMDSMIWENLLSNL